ncbi:MAG: glycosyltransferase family 1 protein [Cyanobacteria bacterium P01_H01_bin.74]
MNTIELPEQDKNTPSVLIVTDAWKPQTNGVVTTVTNTRHQLKRKGFRLYTLTPSYFKLHLPTYDPGVKVAIPSMSAIAKYFRKFQPDYIFIMTEGPLGLAIRHFCIEARLPFTTAFATKWPDYLKQHLFIPRKITWRMTHWFHAPAHAVMVATQSLRNELKAHGLHNIQPWTRGVDTKVFKRVSPEERAAFHPDCPRPFYIYAGRVSSEKNIEAFLSLDLPGTKIVVGKGADLEALKIRYPAVIFKGLLTGKALATCYACSDIFVFPSKTDTFGLVMLEAMASGLPVVAFNVTGPADVIDEDAQASQIGFLASSDERLRELAIKAWETLKNNTDLPLKCRHYVLQHYSWQVVADMLVNNLKRCTVEMKTHYLEVT